MFRLGDNKPKTRYAIEPAPHKADLSCLSNEPRKDAAFGANAESIGRS
jgi:hypothetical protein